MESLETVKDLKRRRGTPFAVRPSTKSALSSICDYINASIMYFVRSSMSSDRCYSVTEVEIRRRLEKLKWDSKLELSARARKESFFAVGLWRAHVNGGTIIKRTPCPFEMPS